MTWLGSTLAEPVASYRDSSWKDFVSHSVLQNRHLNIMQTWGEKKFPFSYVAKKVLK